MRGVIGEELRLVRLARELTPEQLSHHSGVDTRLINEIEAGLVEPDIETLFRLATALDVEADEMVMRVWEKTRGQPPQD